MNTRTDDLGKLEAQRDAGNPYAKMVLDKVYKQSQDPEIERLRKLLIEAHSRRDFKAVEELGETLSKYNH